MYFISIKYFYHLSYKEKLIKLNLTTFILFGLVGVYYYQNLPKYTYQETQEKVKNYVSLSGETESLETPIHREDMRGIATQSS